MCYTEHVYHRPCSHWGRERIVGEPCCRARIVNGRHTSCLYTETIGSVNSSQACAQCIYRQTKGREWRPFAHVRSRARVEEELHSLMSRLP